MLTRKLFGMLFAAAAVGAAAAIALIIFALRLDDACKCHTYYDNSCSSNASWR